MEDILVGSEKIRKDMMELWKETFHDSDRYVRLVFETYFSLDNSFVRYHENRLIASLLSIPYEFQILAQDGSSQKRKGIYLCGLATRKEYRKKGIMSELMKEAEHAAKNKGFEYSILIPADSHLRNYYAQKGYQTSSWRVCKEYELKSTDKNNIRTPLHIYAIKDFHGEGQTDFLKSLADWCKEIELSRAHNTIVHSQKDFLAIMVENENSIFLTDSSFDRKKPNVAYVRCVAFPELTGSPEDAVRIVGLYSRNETKEGHPGNYKRETSGHEPITSDQRRAILRRFKVSKMELMVSSLETKSKNGRVYPYAMMKNLRDAEQSIESTNQQCEISLMLD